MITPRQTRLLRVPDLHAFQHVLSAVTGGMDPIAAQDCAVLLPNHAAAVQLRQTLEAAVLDSAGVKNQNTPPALPDFLTRKEWYQRLYERLRPGCRLLNEFQREVMMSAAARHAARQTPPPFRLRAGLIVEIVRLYDGLRRLQHSVDDFKRLLINDLEADAESDKGAARLLLQTRFLANTFQEYETRLEAASLIDEHRLRQRLLTDPLKTPYQRVIVAVADCAAEPEGLWPADFDLLTRLPLLTHLDVVATEQLLAAGLHERLHRFLPGMAEEKIAAQAGEVGKPVLLRPPALSNRCYFRSRDREDELADLICRLTTIDRPSSPRRTAVIFKRPLPYLYLAQEVFGSGGMSYQTSDALPLAAEPYAAALDLVFDFVASNFGRASMIALLRSPFVSFSSRGVDPDTRSIAALDRTLADAGYLGGFDALRELVREWPNAADSREQTASVVSAANAALEAARELMPLLQPAPASHHLGTLQTFLTSHDRVALSGDGAGDRQLRSRAAIHAAIESLRIAHIQIDDPMIEFVDVTAALRRWIEGQTFAAGTGTGGVHLVDAQAARFGSFDDVHLLGLVDADWPDRTPRNVFFPTFLLQQHFGWPAEADRLRAVRAAFRDLVHLPRRRLSLSAFALEDEAVVGPSVFLEDLDQAEFDSLSIEENTRDRVFPSQAIPEEPVVDAPPGGLATAWLALRKSRTDGSQAIFHGQANSHQRGAYAVGALETYLECPFKFFAKHVLRLDEEQRDEYVTRPRLQGIFLHRVFEAFFNEWGRLGRSAITLENLELAKEVFARIVEPLLAELPDADAALERDRLFGTAAAEGLADIVFRIEAEWETGIVERLLEYRFEGQFEIQGAAGSRRVSLTGVADRIDLLEDGTLRVIDYKSGRPPSSKRMLQLPVYSVCASQLLQGRHGRAWTVGEGGYIAFKDPRRYVPLGDRTALDQVVRDAQTRLLDAIGKIEGGEFPPTPLEPFRCTFCGYSGVCRKDYVGDE